MARTPGKEEQAGAGAELQARTAQKDEPQGKEAKADPVEGAGSWIRSRSQQLPVGPGPGPSATLSGDNSPCSLLQNLPPGEVPTGQSSLPLTPQASSQNAGPTASTPRGILSPMTPESSGSLARNQQWLTRWQDGGREL